MASEGRDEFEYALKSNRAWADYKGHQNPKFFEKLATGQSPSILWIGCSDSRVPETTILGLSPGDVFVHRNIGNIISPQDINSMAVIEYAVAHLKVKHIVLCGHTCCGGANAALDGGRVGGVIDAWITPLRTLCKVHEAEIKSISDAGARAARLAELNVTTGVSNLLGNYVVDEAMNERGLEVHGVIYDVASGKLRDLKIPTGSGKKLGKGSDGAFDMNQHGDTVKGNFAKLVFGGDGATMEIR